MISTINRNAGTPAYVGMPTGASAQVKRMRSDVRLEAGLGDRGHVVRIATTATGAFPESHAWSPPIT